MEISNGMKQIICIGSACKDIFFPTDEGKIMETPDDFISQKKITFELGAKYGIKERHESLGGCAANAAVGLSKLGIQSACATGVGGDEIGSWIKKELENNNSDTSLIVTEEDKRSNLSAIIIDESSADRIIFSSRETNKEITVDKEKVADAGWFFISDIQGKWEDQLEAIFELAKTESKKVAFNPREAGIHEDAAEIIEAIGLVEILFVNKDEAIEIVSNAAEGANPENINDEKFLLQSLKNLEPKVVAITDGKKGAWATDGENIFFAEGQKVLAVDSTGAGDAFSSGFMAAYIKGKNLSECLQWGIANGSSTVQFYGGTEGLLDESQMIIKAGEVKINKI